MKDAKRQQIQEYFDIKWYLTEIRHGSKCPILPQWNVTANALTKVPLNGNGVGILHAPSGTMAFDVDDLKTANYELERRNIDLESLFQDINAVSIDSGVKGHGKLLYRMPNGPLPSHKLIATRPDGTSYNYIDFRCGTTGGLSVQDVLPPSIHPVTKRAYSWGGVGDFHDLPVIPEALLQMWKEGLDPPSLLPTPKTSTNWSSILKALNLIPPDVDREQWIKIGLALHQEDTFEGLEVWDTWSQGPVNNPSLKYPGFNDLESQWSKFHQDGKTTPGTIYFLAEAYGYIPNITDPVILFKDIDIEQSKSMILSLRAPAPLINLDHWPSALVEQANLISENMGCDPLVPLYAGLAAICGVIDSRSRLDITNSFSVPPVLWLMTVGNPSDKKSPASGPMLDPLRAIEISDRPAFNQRKALHSLLEKQYQEDLGKFELEYTDENPMVAPTPVVPPLPLRIIVQDITSQRLTALCAERPAGMICHLDEMHNWVDKLTSSHSIESRSTWIGGFECKSHVVDRVSTASIEIDNFAVTLYGNIQPSVLAQHMTQLANDGLLARFLPAILRKDHTCAGDPSDDFLSVQHKWNTLLMSLQLLQSTRYQLSPEAYKVYREFQYWYYKLRSEELLIKADDDYMKAFGKLEGQLGRLILVFHMIKNPHVLAVPVQTVTSAINVIKDYIIPSLRYLYHETGNSEILAFDEWLLFHVLSLSGKQDSLSLRDIKRSARRRMQNFTGPQQTLLIRNSMAPLEDQQWVKIIKDEPHKNVLIWKVNDSPAKLFQSERDKILQIKKERSTFDRPIPKMNDFD